MDRERTPKFLIAALSGANQAFAIFALPESLGCTPSLVSLLVLNPEYRFTTVIGLCPVVSPAAHAGIALSSACTPEAQSEHPDGFMGVI